MGVFGGFFSGGFFYSWVQENLSDVVFLKCLV